MSTLEHSCRYSRLVSAFHLNRLSTKVQLLCPNCGYMYNILSRGSCMKTTEQITQSMPVMQGMSALAEYVGSLQRMSEEVQGEALEVITCM